MTSQSNFGAIGTDPERWHISISLSWTNSTLVWRNGPNVNQGYFERTIRIFTAELAFALLVVASLVESIFRGSLTIPGLIATGCCCLENRTVGLIEELTMAGPIISFLNTWVAFVALAKNPLPGRLEYGQILPCVQDIYDELSDPDKSCCYEYDYEENDEDIQDVPPQRWTIDRRPIGSPPSLKAGFN